VNAAIEGTRLVPDFLWPEYKLILEADSKTFHDQLLARADDRARQEILEGLGYTVLRTSWAECTSRPDRMIARVNAARAA
jgi:very-short-patch-repair endonuclease